MKYEVHPDFEVLTHIYPPINRWTLPVLQGLMGLLYSREKSDAQVRVERLSIPGPDGNRIRALLYSPVEAEPDAPCLLYSHGGGYVFPAAPYQYALARRYTREVKCRTLFVDYRLAPQHPFPAAPKDCFAAYEWLQDNAARLGIDPARIAVCGDSAGGGLSLAVSIMAAEKGLPGPCAQLLTYPAVGNCGETESIRRFTDTPMCNSKDMDKYGRMYIPDPSAGPLAWRSPVQADNLGELSETYIETAEFDSLRDGAHILAQRMTDAGVSVEVHDTKGTVHGYDMALKSGIVEQCIRDRIAFLQRVFSKG